MRAWGWHIASFVVAVATASCTEPDPAYLAGGSGDSNANVDEDDSSGGLDDGESTTGGEPGETTSDVTTGVVPTTGSTTMSTGATTGSPPELRCRMGSQVLAGAATILDTELSTLGVWVLLETATDVVLVRYDAEGSIVGDPVTLGANTSLQHARLLTVDDQLVVTFESDDLGAQHVYSEPFSGAAIEVANADQVSQTFGAASPTGLYDGPSRRVALIYARQQTELVLSLTEIDSQAARQVTSGALPAAPTPLDLAHHPQGGFIALYETPSSLELAVFNDEGGFVGGGASFAAQEVELVTVGDGVRLVGLRATSTEISVGSIAPDGSFSSPFAEAALLRESCRSMSVTSNASEMVIALVCGSGEAEYLRGLAINGDNEVTMDQPIVAAPLRAPEQNGQRLMRFGDMYWALWIEQSSDDVMANATLRTACFD